MSEDHNSHAYAVMFDQIGTVRWQLVHSKCYGNNEFLCILPQEDGTFVLVFEYSTYAYSNSQEMNGLNFLQISRDGEILCETELLKIHYWGCYPVGPNLIIKRIGSVNYMPEWEWVTESVAMLECVNAKGELLWRHTYPDLVAIGWDLAVIPTDDGYYLAGGRDDRLALQYMSVWAWVAKLDTEGSMLWYKELETGEMSRFTSVLPREDGGIIIAGGYADDMDAGMEGVVVWMDAEGTIERLQTYPVGQYTLFTDMLPYEDGYLLMGSTPYCRTLPMVVIDSSGDIIKKWDVQTPYAESMQSARLYAMSNGYMVVAMAHVDEDGDINNGDVILMPVELENALTSLVEDAKYATIMSSSTPWPFPSESATTSPESLPPQTPGPAATGEPITGAGTEFPKAYKISDTDAKRYQRIRQSAIANIPTWIPRLFPTLEEKVAQWTKFRATTPGKYYDAICGFPSEHVISEEWAVFLGYAALEERYGYDEEVLSVYYPDMIYDIKVADKPVWIIRFVPYALGRYGSYYVEIEAKTGIIINFRAPEDPKG